MTYDLTIERIEEIETDPDAVKAALAKVQAAGHRMHDDLSSDAARDEMIAALIELYQAEPAEFELTAGSMTDCLNAMDRLGMIELDAVAPKLPTAAEFGVEPGMWSYDEGDEVPGPIAAYLAAMATATAAQAEEPAGIPAYKLRTNDGWLVTEAEIRSALTAHAAPRPTAPSPVTEPDYFWWPHWLDFLRLAADHGGFRVH